jgi:hypothetical protein
VNDLLVCGGRDFQDYRRLKAELDRLHSERPITSIIHGAARGADMLADAWARHNKVRVRRFIAEWNKHGKAAGVIRNRKMLTDGKPNFVLAFPGGRGTANMIEQALDAGLVVVRG